MNPRQIRILAVAFGLGILATLGIALSRFSTKPVVYVSGTVALDNSLLTQAIGIRTVFISVFDASQKGPPFGAARFELSEDAKGEFLSFNLTPANLMVMNPNLQIPQKMLLKARLDTTAKAGPDKPGDLIGFSEAFNSYAAILINQQVSDR